MYEMVSGTDLERPVLVVALDGWVNAGQAASIAADVLVGDGPVVARFDPDLLYDYRMVRPVVQFEDGVMAGVEWPEMTVRMTEGSAREVLVLAGTEPNWGWKAFSTAVAALCRELGVAEYVGIGGVPWATPHTRAVTIMTTASSEQRLPEDAEALAGQLRVPGAAVSVVEWAAIEAGIPTIGFWARVPNYVGADYPAAAGALLDRLSLHLGVAFDLGDLRQQIEVRREELDAVAAQRPEVQEVISQLEQIHDSTQSVSGDDLASEIERFLRDQQ